MGVPVERVPEGVSVTNNSLPSGLKSKNYNLKKQ